MADFRKWFMVVAVVLLAAASASAANWTLPCATIAATPTIIRTGGITEYIGEIDLACDSSSLTPIGDQVQINFTLTVNSTVTNSVSSGFTMAGAIVQRTSQPHRIFSAVQGNVTDSFPGHNNALFYANVTVPTGTTFGVRFINVRVAATALTSTPTNFQGLVEVVAVLAGQSSQAGGINVSAGQQPPSGMVVAYIQPTMTFAVTDCVGLPGPATIPLQQCVDYGLNGPQFPGRQRSPVFGVTFKETINNVWAFKNVIDEDGATVPDFEPGGTQFNGFTGPPTPTQICDTDHMGIGDVSVMADSFPPTPPCTPNAWVSNGSRLVATFAISDPRLVGKIHIWVSTEATNSTTGASALLATIHSPAGKGAIDYPDSGPTVNCSAGNGPKGYWVELPDAGVETAAWELTSENGSIQDDLTFGVAITYNEEGLPSLPVGSAYSPLTISGTMGPIDLTTPAPVSLAAEPVVRFNLPPTQSPVTVQIDHCVTNLLFPYVTDVFGYQTGFAISNTSLDTAWNLDPVVAAANPLWGTVDNPMPYNTTPQAGTCNLYLFGSTAAVSQANLPPPAGVSTPITPVKVFAVATANVAAGQTFADTIDNVFGVVSGDVSNEITGYIIARCEFQFAHGYAFIVTPGGQPQSYLALIIPDRNILNPDPLPGTGFTSTPIRIAQPFSNAIFDEQGEMLAE
jgi:hypothetical protein